MALIKQVKQIKKVQIQISASKDLADKYNSLIDSYNKKFGASATLDFDPLVKKIIDELNSLVKDPSDESTVKTADKVE